MADDRDETTREILTNTLVIAPHLRSSLLDLWLEADEAKLLSRARLAHPLSY